MVAHKKEAGHDCFTLRCGRTNSRSLFLRRRKLISRCPADKIGIGTELLPRNVLRERRTASFEAYPGELDLFRAMAGDEMPRVDFAEVGRLCAADLRRIGAARVEVAA